MDTDYGGAAGLTAQDIDGLAAAMQAALAAAGPGIVARAGKVQHYTDKQDGSPVTDTDIAVERRIQAAMQRRYPQVPVFGEETGYGTNLPPVFWLVDPIDGTESFIRNIPTFTSMAVLIQNNEAVASVLYNPSRRDMYVARKGQGAYKNGQRLDIGSMPVPPVAFCKQRFFAAFNAMLRPLGVTCQNGPSGGGYGFMLVADGQSAARFNVLGRGYVHDYAPGALLVREAGGGILPVQDETYTYTTRSFIACHPALVPLLQPRLAEIRTLEQQLAG